jgi:hypothetical protein
MFFEILRTNGWTELAAKWEYAKGDWKIDFDTGHWMIVSTKHNPRLFDVPIPGELDAKWTVKLIEHLCRMDDERFRLREDLRRIRDKPTSGDQVRAAAAAALQQCYHSWIVNLAIPDGQTGRLYCCICGQTKATEIEPA